MEFTNTKVISNRHIASDIWVLKVKYSSANIAPGQFFMLKAWKSELPLMRPISVYQFNNEEVQFMYRVVGKGTDWFSTLKRGAVISMLGPLGNGFPCHKVSGNIALVGGGVGIPPLYETAKLLSAQGNNVDVYLGFRDSVFICEEFENVCRNIFISTETGSEGYKGFITDLFDPSKYDALFTCGPEVMMNKLLEKCKAANVPAWLSMERRMGCGIGACLVCTCETKNGMKRACSDGPVFSHLEL